MREGVRRRVALIGPVAPFRGGIAQFTDALTGGLRERGHDVFVATFRRQYPALLFPGASQFDPRKQATPGSARLIDSLRPDTWIRTANALARRGVTVAVFQYWMPFFAPAYGILAQRLARRGIRVVAVVHNVIPHERSLGYFWLGRFFLRRCEMLLALSNAVADDLRTLGVTAPVHVSPHPVYHHFGDLIPRKEARGRLGLARDDEVLLFFGVVRSYKGLPILLNAMPRIVARRPRVRLIVAGEFYEDEGVCRSLIETLGLGEIVLVRPEYIPEEEVSVFFSAANLVVQPYVSATQSGVVQTAFHFDRPVVVTDVGGLAEVVADGRSGYVVPPRDPAALADAVVRYFEDGKEPVLAHGVRHERKRFSWACLLSVLEGMMGTGVRGVDSGG